VEKIDGGAFLISIVKIMKAGRVFGEQEKWISRKKVSSSR
jgi:hypothetical protein